MDLKHPVVDRVDVATSDQSAPVHEGHIKPALLVHPVELLLLTFTIDGCTSSYIGETSVMSCVSS